jgi:type II secretory pathway pseudopilin PulG
MKKAFTITELLVAMGLLAAVLAASGVVFHYSIDAQRTASATAEIMRTLRAITEQLNADFAGIQKNAPMIIGFRNDSNGPQEMNADFVVFFAVGDFQTTNPYPNSSGETVRGNVARIYYGQAQDPYLLSAGENDRRNKILARKQVILAPAESDSTGEYEPNSLSREVGEYLEDYNAVSGWWLERPEIDPNDANEIPMYFAKGVDNFSIEFDQGIDVNDNIKWRALPDGEEGYFGFAGYRWYFRSYPSLIKFTFTLYDSKGILKNGRRFEHIVYIGR